jgi:hypothetical protein
MILADNLDQTIPIVCNTADELVRANVQAACELDLPWLDLVDAHDRPAIVVGGGPSMRPLLPMIAAMQAGGATVFATNGTVAPLFGAGVLSNHQVLLDARPENVAFVAGPKAQHYLIASQCHPDLFRAIAGRPATLWHPAYPEIDEWIGHREAVLIGGGTTVGLQAMSIASTAATRRRARAMPTRSRSMPTTTARSTASATGSLSPLRGWLDRQWSSRPRPAN